MPSKKELEAEIERLHDVADTLRGAIREGDAAFTKLSAKKHVIEGKYNRLQTTIVELNKRNNRLRDHIVRGIEHG